MFLTFTSRRFHVNMIKCALQTNTIQNKYTSSVVEEHESFHTRHIRVQYNYVSRAFALCCACWLDDRWPRGTKTLDTRVDTT